MAEAEEETGFRVTRVENVFEAFMSPGSVTEKLCFFIAEYDERQRSGEGAASSRRVKISTCWSWISIRRYGRSGGDCGCEDHHAAAASASERDFIRLIQADRCAGGPPVEAY